MGSKPGRKPGPGRPKTVKHYSDDFKEKIWKALDAEAKKQGKTVFEVFAQRLLNPNNKQPQMWSVDFGRLVDILVAKETKSTIEKHEIGPRIGLPPIKQPDEDTIYPKMAPKGLMN
jgi:hypothetical protein